jgi:tRNA-dihydrouridine synthase B
MKNTPYFYLAPLRGVTDNIFRNAFENHFGKFDFLLAPFIPTVKGSYVNPSHVRDVDPEHNDTNRVIPQIIGNDATDIITLANHMASLGYQSVNLNLGCPHPQITRKKRGSGLLPYPEMIKTLLDKIMSEIKCSFSVKVRLGLLSADDLDLVIPVLNQFPLAEVIIHPRTGVQMYEGTVDLESFQKYSAMLKSPVTYNGDIWSLDHFKRYSSLFQTTTRWMLGRGVVSNPFLLKELADGAIVKKDISVLKSFHDELFRKSSERLSGPSHLLGKMKEFWSYVANMFSDSKRILKKVQKKTSIIAYQLTTDEIFEKEPLI